MSRTGWKQVEREAAAALGGARFWANAGEREDVETRLFVAQVKNPRRLSLNELGLLVDEMTLRGFDLLKLPVVLVKQSARRPTQLLAVLPASVLRAIRQSYLEPAAALHPEEIRALPRACLHELPGMRRRVAAYVEKSRRRAGRRP